MISESKDPNEKIVIEKKNMYQYKYIFEILFIIALILSMIFGKNVIEMLLLTISIYYAFYYHAENLGNTKIFLICCFSMIYVYQFIGFLNIGIFVTCNILIWKSFELKKKFINHIYVKDIIEIILNKFIRYDIFVEQQMTNIKEKLKNSNLLKVINCLNLIRMMFYKLLKEVNSGVSLGLYIREVGANYEKLKNQESNSNTSSMGGMKSSTKKKVDDSDSDEDQESTELNQFKKKE